MPVRAADSDDQQKKYSSPKRAAGSAYVGESATMRWPDFTIYQKAAHKQ
jgi:hypothetical protein